MLFNIQHEQDHLNSQYNHEYLVLFSSVLNI